MVKPCNECHSSPQDASMTQQSKKEHDWQQQGLRAKSDPS